LLLPPGRAFHHIEKITDDGVRHDRSVVLAQDATRVSALLSKRLGAHKELVRGQAVSGFREHSVTEGFRAACSELNHFKDWSW
jgi:hypothetical protein